MGLAPGDREKVFELNARRVYPRLDAALAARRREAAPLRPRQADTAQGPFQITRNVPCAVVGASGAGLAAVLLADALVG